MIKINYWIIGLLFSILLIATGCNDYEAPILATEVEEVTVNLNTVESAISNGLGLFNVKVNDSDIKLSLSLIGVFESDNAHLPTGTYRLGMDKAEYSIIMDSESSYWSSNNGSKTHNVNAGSITVETNNGKSDLFGKLIDSDGNILNFTSNDVLIELIDFQNYNLTEVIDAFYEVKYGQGLYKVILSDIEGKLFTELHFYSTRYTLNQTFPEMNSGQYIGRQSAMTGSLLLPSSYWIDVDAAEKNELSDAFFTVTRSIGSTEIKGVLTNKDGNSISVNFKEKLMFNAGMLNDQGIFTGLTDVWEMEASQWYVYDKTEDRWLIKNEPNETTNVRSSWIGVPHKNLLFASDLWNEETSGLIIGVTADNKLQIPLGYSSNPLFIMTKINVKTYYVHTYLLFPAMYDPTTSFLLAGGSMDLEISEDMNEISVVARQEANNDGELINFEYFGVFGLDLEYGNISMIDNFSFAHLPTFKRNTSKSINTDSFFNFLKGDMNKTNISTRSMSLANKELIYKIDIASDEN